jgi:hypothetical protein
MILLADENLLPAVTTSHDVIDGSWILESRWSSHPLIHKKTGLPST